MNREAETSETPWLRTKADYLQILEDGQTQPFGDYDNSSIFFGLVNDGLAEIDQSKGQSVWTGMFQSVWLKLTDAGRDALEKERGDG